ncbi:hypothetical protein LCGC14_2413770, partial [marine sediment metagenome]
MGRKIRIDIPEEILPIVTFETNRSGELRTYLVRDLLSNAIVASESGTVDEKDVLLYA